MESMDLDEWEILPQDGFVNYHEDGEKKRTFVATKVHTSSFNPKSVFDMNYFMCPTSPTRNHPSQLVPVPINLKPTATTTAKKDPDYETSKVVMTKVPMDIDIVVPSGIVMPRVKDHPEIGSREANTNNQDSVSQVSFKKMKKDNEFADMILGSPKSSTKGSTFVPPPQIEAYNKGEALETKITSPRIKNESTEDSMQEEAVWEENSGGFNLWKWSLNGIGAICSFGVAAATVCIIILGNHQRNKQLQQSQQQLRFQFYSDDKRIKRVVHHATKLNEAFARGVPITRAHITSGGYYEGL